MQAYGPRGSGVAAYQAARETLSPQEIIVLLYEGAIRRLMEAKDAIAQRRIEERFHAVMKAHAIVSGLQGQLDFKAGGEVAETLDRFYAYILHRMLEINIKNDAAICDELIGHLKTMHASWAHIAGRIEPETPPGPPRDGILASA